MPLPGNFSTVPVHGKYLDLAGAALAGTVTFTATPDALTDPAALIIIMSKPLVMTLDVNGEFTTNLPATDDPDIDPIGFTYKVVEAFPGRDVAGREYYITVPVASLPGGIDLTTAAPAIPVDGVARGQFLNDLGDVDTTGAVTDSPLVRDSTGEWVAGPALSATYAALGASNVFTAGTHHFDFVTGGAQRTPFTSRLTDSGGAAINGGVVVKPSGDTTEAIVDWAHDGTSGFLFHLTTSTNIGATAALVGLGIHHTATGLVVDNYAAGTGIGLTNEAGSTGVGFQANQFGSGKLFQFIQALTGTPGTILSIEGWSGAPAASRLLTLSTDGNENVYVDNAGTLNLTNASHRRQFTMGSGPGDKLYVYTGTPNLWWANTITTSTNHLLIQSAAGAAAQGSESMNTMIDISNGNTMGFFGSTGSTKPTVTGSRGANAALASLLTQLAGLGLITDSSS